MSQDATVTRRFGDVAACVLTTASSFAVFSYTLCPDVYAGDSGELAMSAHLLSVPHPPGYPLFVIVGRLFVLLSLAEPAYLTNLMSAVLASITAGLLCLLAVRITSSRFLGVMSGLILAFSKSFWAAATVTEVYALESVMVILILLCLEKIERTDDERLLFLLFYLGGISLVAHQALVLFIPAIVYAGFKKRRMFGRPQAGKFFLAAMVFLLGVSPYAFILVRTSADPSAGWSGYVGINDLFSYLLRRNYGSLGQNPLSVQLLLGDLQAFFSLLVKEFPPLVLLLSVPGLIRLKRERRFLAECTAIMFASYLFGLLLLIRPYPDSVHMYQLSALFIPLYIIVAFWIGMGFRHAALAVVDNPILRQRVFSSRASNAIRVPGKVLWGANSRDASKVGLRFLMLSFSIVPVWMATANFSAGDRSDFFDCRVYGENILRSLPEGATLVVDGDNESFIIAYLTRSLGLRPDVKVYNGKGYIFPAPDYMKRAGRSERLRMSLDWRRRILMENDPVYFATYCDLSGLGGWKLRREGILFLAERMNETGEERDNGEMLDSEEIGEGVEARSQCSDYLTSRNRTLLSAYDMEVINRSHRSLDFIVRKFAIGYLQALWETSKCAGDYEEAQGYLEKIASMGYDFAQANYLVASEMENNGLLEKAYDYYFMSARLDPNVPYAWKGLERVGRKLSEGGDPLLLGKPR